MQDGGCIKQPPFRFMELMRMIEETCPDENPISEDRFGLGFDGANDG
jgi:hypothetical protein